MSPMFRLLHSLAFLALLAFTLSSCKRARLTPFPASGDVSGWVKTDDTRVFAANDLWQYIDGDSEQYLQAGVVSTSTSDYKFQNQVEAVVDVHTMHDAAGATRILNNGRSPDAQTVAVGDGGYAFSQSVVFRKDHYVVRIVAYQTSPQTQQALLSLARAVESRL